MFRQRVLVGMLGVLLAGAAASAQMMELVEEEGFVSEPIDVSDRNDPDGLIEEAREMLDCWDSDAEILARRAVELAPKRAEAHVVLGRALAFNDQPQKALESFNKAIQLSDRPAEALSWRAEAWQKLRKHDKAKADLDRAIVLDPVNWRYYQARADFWWNHGATDKAMKDTELAWKLCQELAKKEDAEEKMDLRTDLAYLAAEAGAFEKALEVSDGLQKAEEDWVKQTYWDVRAEVYAGQGQYEKAIAEISKVIQNTESVTYAFSWRAEYKLKQGRFTAAIADLTVVAAADGEAMDYAARGRAYALSGDMKRAMADAKTAVEGDDWDGSGADLMGILHLIEGRNKQAAEAFERSLAKEPDYHYALLLRYIAANRAGDASAAEELQKAWDELYYKEYIGARLLALLLGKIDAEQLLVAAGKEPAHAQAELRNDAGYVIANAALIRGDKQTALKWLEKVARQAGPANVTRLLAQADLARLKPEE
ncbi:MAG: tetratricopeptide repeat protein [Phycisphaerae bacterium]